MRLSASPPKEIGKVLEEIKNVGLVLEQGQAKEKSATTRVSKKCDDSIFRTKHALEMIESDCGGLSAAVKGLETQIASLKAVSAPLMEDVPPGTNSQTNPVVSSFLQLAAVPFLNELPSVDKTFNEEVSAGEKLLKAKEAEAGIVPVQTAKALKSEKADTVSDVQARLRTLQTALAEAVAKKEARELVRQHTVHALTTITETCKMYNDGNKKRNSLRQSQVGILSTVTDALSAKLKVQLKEEKEKEKGLINNMNFPEGTEKTIQGMINGNFKNLMNTTFGRAAKDAFQEVNAEVYSEIAEARKKAAELRKFVVKLQTGVNSLESDVERNERKMEKDLELAKKKMIESIRQSEILRDEKRGLEKDEAQIAALTSENAHVLKSINEHSKRLKLLIAASKLRGKIAGIFSMAYADNIKELKETYVVADEHKDAAKKAKLVMEKQRAVYAVAQKKAQNNSISEFGAFLTGNEPMRKKTEVARKAMEAAEKKYEDLSKNFVRESTLANSSFLRAVNLVKTEHELNETIVGLFNRVKQLESEAFVTFTDRSIERLFETNPRVIATALRNSTNELNLKVFDDVETLKRNKKIIGSDKYDIKKITDLKAKTQAKLDQEEKGVRELQQKVEGIKALISSEIQQRADREKNATQGSIRLNTEENKASALQNALDKELKLELLGSKVNSMSEDDVSAILDEIEKRVHEVPMNMIRSHADGAKESVDKQHTLGEMVTTGDRNAPVALGVLSGLSLKLSEDTSETKQKLQTSEAVTATKLKVLKDSINALYKSQKQLKKAGAANKTTCREAEIAKAMKLKLETLAAKERVEFEKVAMQIRVSKAMIAKIEATKNKAEIMLEEAKATNSEENEFTGAVSKKIDTSKASEMQATANIEHQIAVEKLSVEQEKLKSYDDEISKLQEKAAAQGKVVEVKTPQCVAQMSQGPKPKFLQVQQILRNAKAAYSAFAAASAHTSALKASLFVLEKKQGIAQAEKDANKAIADQKANANAEISRVTTTREKETPELKLAEATSMFPVNESSKSEINQENKDVLEQAKNQKSSVAAMMQNASAIATSQAQREAFQEKKQLEKEKKADAKIKKLHSETESIILNREDGLVGAMHDKPAAMLVVRKLAYEAKKRMGTATKRLKDAKFAVQKALQGTKTEASEITHKRLVELKIKMHEAVPVNASFYFLNGEVLFDLHLIIPSTTSVTLKGLLQGITDVVAHAAGVNNAAVTTVLHSREHVSVRIDVHTLAKAQGIAAEMKEFLNDPTGSGFEGYLRRRLTATSDMHAFLKSIVRARWTPSELVKTVKPVKLDKSDNTEYNIDDFMNTYFQTEPTKDDVHIKKIVTRNESYSPFGLALPNLPDASRSNFDRRSPGAYGGVVDRLEFVEYQRSILSLTNDYIGHLAAKAQAVLEMKRAELFAAVSARSAILLGAGLTNTTYVYDSLPKPTQANLLNLDEDIKKKQNALPKFIDIAEEKTEKARTSSTQLGDLAKEQQQLIQSKKSFEIYEQEFDEKKRSVTESKKRDVIAKAAIDKRQEKLRVEKEEIELLNEKKLAEKGQLAKAKTGVTGATGNSMTGGAAATGASSGPVTAEEVKEEEEKKIFFLTKELSTAMETIKIAVDSARIARKKVMANDKRQSEQLKNLTTDLRDNVERNAIFKLGVQRKLAKLQRVQADLVIKVSEARAKAKFAKVKADRRVESVKPSIGAVTRVDAATTGATGTAARAATGAAKRAATGAAKRAATGAATGPAQKMVTKAATGPTTKATTGVSSPKKPKSLAQVVQEAQMSILKPKTRKVCPNGLCECDGLGFKLCECCMTSDITALRKLAEQEVSGEKTDHVMSAFEKLRSLKVKIIHKTHSCDLASSKYSSISKKVKSTTESILSSQEMLQRALTLHDAAQIEEHGSNLKEGKLQLNSLMKEMPGARLQQTKECQSVRILKAELDKKIIQARKLKEQEVKAKNRAAGMLRDSLEKQLEMTTAKFLNAEKRVADKVSEVFNIKETGQLLATGPADEAASATGSGSSGMTGHAPTGLVGGTFTASGGAFYATGPRAINENTGASGTTGATGSATASAYDYALELRAVNNMDRTTVALKPEIYDEQITKTLEVVRREISLVENVEPKSDTEKVKLESVKNWLLKAELKLVKLSAQVQHLVTDVKQLRLFRREIDRLHDMKPSGVVDNAGGKLVGYDKTLSILGEAIFGGYGVLNFGSSEKIFLRVGIAKKLQIASSRVKLNDAVKVDGSNERVKVSFEIGVKNSTMAVNARQQIVGRLSEMTETVFKGLRSKVVYIRHIISGGDKLKPLSEMTEADASERQLAELAGVSADNVTYHAPDAARVLSETLQNEKNSIENAVQRGTFGSLIKAEKDALLKLNSRVQQQCANVARKYHAKHDFDGQKGAANSMRRLQGLSDVTDAQFNEGPTGMGGPTGLYGGLKVATGIEQTSFLQTKGASGATGAAHLKIKQMTDKALQQKNVMSEADDESLENVKAIHMFQEEVEKIMQQKQDRLYKETVEAVANDDDGKLEKKYPLQLLYLRVAKASKSAALGLIKKNRLLSERIRGTASDADVFTAKNASKKADLEAAHALEELKAGKIVQLTKARSTVNEHLRSCTEKAKSWYEVATRNRREQKVKALERARAAEEKSKKRAESITKAKAEQTQKAIALKKVEEKKKKQMAEQAAKKRETLREKLNRMISAAIAQGNKVEEANLRQQLSMLNQVEVAEEHVEQATSHKRKTILSKNHTLIVTADKRLRVAIGHLNNLLIKHSVTGSTGSTGSTGAATGPNDGIIGGCVGLSLHAAVAKAKRRFNEDGTTMSRLFLQTAKNMLNGRRKLCRVQLKLDAARASLRLAESGDERKSMMEDVSRYEDQIRLLKEIAKARIAVRDARLHEVELVDASDLVRSNGARRTKEAVEWLNHLLQYGLGAFATGATGATASTGATGAASTGPTGVETGPTGVENYQALYMQVQQILLNAIAENPVISASEATKKIVHVLLENSAATRKETVFIGKELIRTLEKAQEGISGVQKYGRRIENLLKSSWNTEGYLQLLASFDWKNANKNESAVEHGKTALVAAVQNVGSIKSSLGQARRFLAELKQSDLLLSKFETSNEVLREAIVSPTAKLNRFLVQARSHEAELQKRSHKWIEMVATAQRYVADAHAWEKKRNTVSEQA